MLGHVNLSTTEMYTQVSIKKLKEIHTLTHPAKTMRQARVDWDEMPATEADLLAALTAEAAEEGQG